MRYQNHKPAPTVEASASQVPMIDRAYALAQSGDYKSVNAIKHRLQDEGFEAVAAAIYGPVVFRQLKGMIARRS
jgi:hypothetical protein